jgi:hypothetical protein
MVAISAELVPVLRRGIDRINALPDDNPGKRARRAVEVEWIQTIIRGMGGKQ